MCTRKRNRKRLRSLWQSTGERLREVPHESVIDFIVYGWLGVLHRPGNPASRRSSARAKRQNFYASRPWPRGGNTIRNSTHCSCGSALTTRHHPRGTTSEGGSELRSCSSEDAAARTMPPRGVEKGTAGLTLGLLTGHSNRAELGCSKNNPGTLRHRADRGFTVARPGGHPNLNTRQVQKKRSSPAAWLTSRHEAGGRGTVL